MLADSAQESISVSSRLVSQLPSKVCMYFVHCTLWQAGKCLITKSNQSNFGTKPIAYPLRRALIIWHKASIPYPLRRVLATLQILFSGTRPLFSGSSCTIPSTERFGYLTQSLYTIPSPEGFCYFTIHGIYCTNDTLRLFRLSKKAVYVIIYYVLITIFDYF